VNRTLRRSSGQERAQWSVLAVLLMAFALRFVNLNGRAMWYDEAFAVLYAEKPFDTMLYGTVAQVEGAAADVHPLFFYSILHLWMQMVGQAPVAVRGLSALLGTATVVVLYLLAHQLFERKIALAIAAIAAVAPFQVYYGQEARMYALLAFSAITAAYFFLRAWIEGRCIFWIAFGLFGAMTLDLWVLWAWFRPGGHRWCNLGPLAASHGIMLVLFAPWLMVVPSQFGKIQQAYWVEQPGITTLLQTILIFHFAYDNQALPGWLLPVAIFFSLLITVLIGYELVRRRGPTAYQSRWGSSVSLVLSLVIVPIVLLFLLSQIRPVYIVRALLPSGLAYCALAGSVLFSRMLPKPVKWGLVLPSAVIVVASLVNHYTYAQFPRPPFDRAAVYLRAHYQPGDAIVHSNKLTFLPVHYYDRALPQEFVGDEPGSSTDTLAYPTQQALGLYASADLVTAVSEHERVWFVVFRREIEEYLAAGETEHPYLAYLEERYVRASITPFNDLLIYEYRVASQQAGARYPERQLSHCTVRTWRESTWPCRHFLGLVRADSGPGQQNRPAAPSKLTEIVSCVREVPT
jgi:mannosyltransferase